MLTHQPTIDSSKMYNLHRNATLKINHIGFYDCDFYTNNTVIVAFSKYRHASPSTLEYYPSGIYHNIDRAPNKYLVIQSLNSNNTTNVKLLCRQADPQTDQIVNFILWVLCLYLIAIFLV